MSWLYLPAAAEDCSPANTSSGGEQSATSSETDIASKSSRRESATDSSMTRRSGTMSRHSTGAPGVDMWISSLRDSPASRSRSPGRNWGTRTRETCGRIRFVSLTRCGPRGAYWRTSPRYDALDGRRITARSRKPRTSGKYYATWPRAGLMLAGKCYRLPSWERRICEIASGLWPTLRAGESGNYQNDRGDRRKPRLTLTGLLRLWPTLTARDCRSRKGALPPPNHQGGINSVQAIGGSLNPAWCEWYQGWPIGWTALEPLETARFREWLRQHGRSCHDRDNQYTGRLSGDRVSLRMNSSGSQSNENT